MILAGQNWSKMTILFVLLILGFLQCSFTVSQETIPTPTVELAQDSVTFHELSNVAFRVKKFQQNFATAQTIALRLAAGEPSQYFVAQWGSPFLSSTSASTSATHQFNLPFNSFSSLTVGSIGICYVKPLAWGQSYQVGSVFDSTSFGPSHYEQEYNVVFDQQMLQGSMLPFFDLDDFTMFCTGFYVKAVTKLTFFPRGEIIWTNLAVWVVDELWSVQFDLPIRLKPGAYVPPVVSTLSLTKIPADATRDGTLMLSAWENKPLYKHTISFKFSQRPNNSFHRYSLFLPYVAPPGYKQLVPTPIVASATNSTVVGSLLYRNGFRPCHPNPGRSYLNLYQVESEWYFPKSFGSMFSLWELTVIDFSNPIQLTFYTDEITERFGAVVDDVYYRPGDYYSSDDISFLSELFRDPSAFFPVDPSSEARTEVAQLKVDRTSPGDWKFGEFYSGPKNILPAEIFISPREDKLYFVSRYPYDIVTSLTMTYWNSAPFYLEFPPRYASSVILSTVPGNTLTVKIEITSPSSPQLTIQDVQKLYSVGQTLDTCLGFTITSINVENQNTAVIVYTSDGTTALIPV